MAYWILAGLSPGNDPKGVEVAKEVLAAAKPNLDEDLVKMVATAIVAAAGEVAELDRKRKAIESNDHES